MLRTLTRHAVKFLKAEDGPTAVEYAVMLALIIVVCIGAITTLGNNANSTFQNVALERRHLRRLRIVSRLESDVLSRVRPSALAGLSNAA